MFLLGFVCGLLLMMAVALLLTSGSPRQPLIQQAHQDIRDIELQAIREMVALSLMSPHRPGNGFVAHESIELQVLGNRGDGR